MELQINVTARRNAKGDWAGSIVLPSVGGSVELSLVLPRATLETAIRTLNAQGGVNGHESVGKFYDECARCIPAVAGVYGLLRDEDETGREMTPAEREDYESQRRKAIAQGEPMPLTPDEAAAHWTGRQVQITKQGSAPADPLAILGNILTGGLSGAVSTVAKGGSPMQALGSILSGGATSLLGGGPGAGGPPGGGLLGGLIPDPLGLLGGGGGPLGGLLGGILGGGRPGAGGGGLPGIGNLLGGLLGGLPGIPGLPSPQQLMGLAPSALGATGLLGGADNLVSSAPQLFGSMAGPMSNLLRTSLRSVDAAAGALTGDPAARAAIRQARQTAEQRVAAALRMAEAALAGHM